MCGCNGTECPDVAKTYRQSRLRGMSGMNPGSDILAAMSGSSPTPDLLGGALVRLVLTH
jgi:hypothetical protein